ncbi:MAG: hypothetical protein AAGA92_09635 [Planctomycetota bacterium]
MLQPRDPRRWLPLLTFLCCACGPLRQVQAAPSLVDTMDGSAPVLRLLPAGDGTRVVRQVIDHERYRSGVGSEHVLLRTPAGRSAHLGFPLPSSRVLSELGFRADVFCSQAGVQLAVSVSLPRSVDPQTGRPYQLLLRSEEPGRGGEWEELRFSNLPATLDRQLRVARSGSDQGLDARGAYATSLVLIAPAGENATSLWVDQITVVGAVPGGPADAGANPRRDPSAEVPSVEFPRIIQWQGEDFGALQQLGFNTVGMSRPPLPHELQAAREAGLRLVCPPPPVSEPAPSIGAEYEPVLRWQLGGYDSADDLRSAVQRRDLLRRHDSSQGRGTLMAAGLNPSRSSRASGAVLLERSTASGDLTLRETGVWLQSQGRAVRPGTTLWAAIPTQAPQRLSEQARGYGAPLSADVALPYRTLMSLSSAALSSGAGGLYFKSHAPLTQSGGSSLERRLSLELNNRRLALMEPWVVGGKRMTAARSNVAGLTAVVLRAERSFLLAPVYWPERVGLDGGVQPGGPVTFVVPGVPESADAYLVTPAQVTRLRHKRVTGGLRITLDQLPPEAVLLMTDDKRAFSQVAGAVRAGAEQAAKLRKDLVELRLGADRAVNESLRTVGVDQEGPHPLLQQASAEHAAARQYFTQRRWGLAYEAAARAAGSLDAYEAASYRLVVDDVTGVRTGLEQSATMLPTLAWLRGRIQREAPGAGYIAASGFEDLQRMLASGWSHRSLDLDGVEGAVSLSPTAAHSGSYCLRMAVKPGQGAERAPRVFAAPLWVESPPIEVSAGDVLEISAEVRVPEPLLGGDGLLVFDSIGGLELATRIEGAPSWRKTKLWRTVPVDGTVRVTFALAGVGVAEVDSFAVRRLNLKQGPAVASRGPRPPLFPAGPPSDLPRSGNAKVR